MLITGILMAVNLQQHQRRKKQFQRGNVIPQHLQEKRQNKSKGFADTTLLSVKQRLSSINLCPVFVTVADTASTLHLNTALSCAN